MCVFFWTRGVRKKSHVAEKNLHIRREKKTVIFDCEIIETKHFNRVVIIVSIIINVL